MVTVIHKKNPKPSQQSEAVYAVYNGNRNRQDCLIFNIFITRKKQNCLHFTKIYPRRTISSFSLKSSATCETRNDTGSIQQRFQYLSTSNGTEKKMVCGYSTIPHNLLIQQLEFQKETVDQILKQ